MAGKKTAKKQNTSSQINKNQDTGIPMSNEIQMIASIGLMLLMMLSNFGLCGYLGKALSSFFFGIFGCVQYVMPVAVCLGVFLLIANDYSTLAIKKCTAGFVTLIMISAFAQVIYQGGPVDSSELFSLAVRDHHAGGILGGGIGYIIQNGFGTAGALVIIFCIMMVSLIVLTQRSFVGFFQYNVNRGGRLIDQTRENRRLAKEKRMAKKAQEEESGEDLNEREEKKGRMSSFLKMKSGRKDGQDQEPSNRVKQVEEKLKRLQEKRASKEKGKSARTARERLADEAENGRSVPVFTSSEDVKRKDSVKELHPQIYPVTARDGKTKPFDGELDFSAFSFSSGKSPEEFADEISRNSEDLQDFLSSLEEVVPSYRSKGNANLAELKMQAGMAHEAEAESVDFPDPDAEVLAEDIRQIEEAEVDDFGEFKNTMEEAGDSENTIKEAGVFGQPAGPDLDDSYTRTDSSKRSKTKEESPADSGRISGREEGDFADTGRMSGAEERASKDSGQAAGRKTEEPGEEETTEIRINRAGPVKPAGKPEGSTDSSYIIPPFNLLTIEKQGHSDSLDRELKETAMKLQNTLESFGVRVTITDISCGPAVTRYELFPEQGTKVSKIVSLSDDIKLNLAAADIRIEAPIPGKAAIGIEVPNKETTKVHLRELLDSRLFRASKSKLTFAVGKDIGGKIVLADLAKMPHLLIAGSTGSGKSVCINTLIISILYHATPEEVKLIMIDPKMVELNVYNGIPHLLIPVVTDPKKASGALNWAVAEMTDRYKKFAQANVRNLEGYNKKMEELAGDPDLNEEMLKKMPQIVIIIDELADLMMVAPGEIEEAIVRLSQLARAAGIHLVVATQRPSVNVITGLIKANVPSRIAFAVSSGVDSRTIIDMNGAEKLLGKGDMLFYPSGYQKPVRVQGALASDAEVAAVVDFIKSNEGVAAYDDEVKKNIEEKTVSASAPEEQDEYFEAAARFIMEKDKATIGMLQRMFKIGFNRAARIMDQLADAGIVGPEEGTKPRQIIMTPEELEEYFS